MIIYPPFISFYLVRDILQMYRRRYMFKGIGLEIMLDREGSGGTDNLFSYFFKFNSKQG